MKKTYILLIALCFFATTKAQIVNIPDANFKAKLLESRADYGNIAYDFMGNSLKIDVNTNGEIEESEALLVGMLDISYGGIADLTGILSFQNLKGLNCGDNKLTNLDLSGLTNLTSLDCYNNSLINLNISGLTDLESLNCNSNSLSSLILISFPNLKTLECSNNSLSSLDVRGLTNLKELSCGSNQMTSLDLGGLTNIILLECKGNSLSSLDISGLTNLTRLECGYNSLSSLDVSGLTNLTHLEFEYNSLSSLDVSGLSNLSVLDCTFNSLSSLDVSGLANLESLLCPYNSMTSLNVSGAKKLGYFDCNGNSLTSLDVNDLINLYNLNCSRNLLTSLDVSGLTNLKDLNCFYNSLNLLNVKNAINLTSLNCNNNLINSLDISNLINLASLNCEQNHLQNLILSGTDNLYFLNCYDNLLPSLDVSDSVNLTSLDCAYNLLTSLDVSGLTKLGILSCSDNLLTTLDVNELKNLKEFYCSDNKLVSLFAKNGRNEAIGCHNNPNLEYICVDDFQLTKIQNEINYYGYTNCHVNSYCSFTPGGDFYTIKGNLKLDSNNNGCDALDLIVPNLKFTITDGITSGSLISDASGNYSIPVQAGTHTITPVLENSAYFTISPVFKKVVFPTQASPFTQDFCITPNGVRPDLEITLLPLHEARPGFDAEYKIVYKNKGNTTQSGSVNLTFDDAVLGLVVANPVASTETVNNLSWDFTDLKPFETREITFTMNVNSPMETPAVNNDDVLNFTTTITSSATDETPLDNTFTFNQTVVGSYDPNDKTCLEGSVITPALIGQYVHYLIRFENTGTFAATNVVVKDMIDLSKFDISSLVPTNASHSFVTNITAGNKVEFIFEKINLPFDDANNDGYIAFKIKTKPSLVVNDSFTNEANIYFDYNFPILTNKATSTFKTLGTPDFDFTSYFTVYPNPAKADLNITARESINVKSISVYNTLGQLVLVVTNAEKVSKIDVSSLTSGNYFIKINSDKGSSSARFVKE